MAKTSKKYYVVRRGRVPGIYQTWDECKEQTTGFSGAEFKSFTDYNEALEFMGEDLPLTDKKSDNALTASEDMKSHAIAYVDGSYDIKTKRFSSGAVIIFGGEEIYLSRAYDDPELAQMRNVAGEIKAAEMAMDYCINNNIEALVIYHDYEGIEKWCNGAWKTNKDGTKAYKEFYNNAIKKVKISFVKVKGHSGDKYNDMADALAKQALKN